MPPWFSPARPDPSPRSATLRSARLLPSSAALWLIPLGIAALLLAPSGPGLAKKAHQGKKPKPAPPRNVTLSDDDDDKSLQLIVGGTVTVSLSAQLGTGYGWAVGSQEGKALTLIREETLHAAEIPAGGAERQRFIYKASRPGRAAVTLQYARPWEKDTPPSKIFRFSAEIKASSNGAKTLPKKSSAPQSETKENK